MTIIYSKTAAKTIAQLDIKTKQRIRQAIVKPLRGGSSLYRLRVGDRHTVFLYPDADTARQIQQSNSAKKLYETIISKNRRTFIMAKNDFTAHVFRQYMEEHQDIYRKEQEFRDSL